MVFQGQAVAPFSVVPSQALKDSLASQISSFSEEIPFHSQFTRPRFIISIFFFDVEGLPLA